MPCLDNSAIEPLFQKPYGVANPLMPYCHHGLMVFREEREQGRANPHPKKLERWVARDRKHLLDEVRTIASACGFSIWQPDRRQVRHAKVRI